MIGRISDVGSPFGTVVMRFTRRRVLGNEKILGSIPRMGNFIFDQRQLSDSNLSLGQRPIKSAWSIAILTRLSVCVGSINQTTDI